MSEIVEVNEKIIKCDGESLDESKIIFAQRHPAIYLKINHDLKADCPYCGRIFVYKNSNSAKAT